MAPKLLLLPVIGCLIGWFTNYLAVRMLFRPKQPVNLLGLRLQGLVPKRRGELAQSIGEAVERELISHEDIRAALSHPELLGTVRTKLHAKIDEFLEAGLTSLGPLLAAFVSKGSLDKISDRVLEEVMRMLPGLVEEITGSLEEKISFREIVVQKIESFEIDKLEEIVLRIASRELKHIELLGGVLGFAIGLVQMLVIHFV